MTTATSTRKPRLTAAEKRALEDEKLRLAKEQMDRRAAYEAETAKLLVDNAEFIAEQTEVFVKTAATLINLVVDTYKPRHTWFRLEFWCSGYDFGIQMEDRVLNTVQMYATVDSKFKINHSTCGTMDTKDILEFSAHLTEIATLCEMIKRVGAPVFDIYEKATRRVRKEDRDADAVDSRVLSAIAKAAEPRIDDFLQLRLGK